MIKILTYNEINPTAWQELVDSSPYATWFQTPEVYQFYEANKEEMNPFAIGVEEDGHLAGVIVGYTTQEKNPIKQYFTCRSIIIGGPLLDEHISNDALSALLLAIKRVTKNSIYVETRNFYNYSHWRDLFEACGFRYQPHYDIHVYCNATHTMSERRQRELKRAVKNGAKIVEASSEQEIRDWYQILSQLYRQKVRTPLWSKAFFLHFYRSGVGKYLLVKYQDKVIGGMMCPILNGRAIYEWYVCGLDEEYRDHYPSVVATYAAIEYAKQNDIPLFDFMGAGTPDKPYGVRDFKAEFGGELVEHGRFLCIRKPLLYWIGKMGVKWLKRSKR
ncbi:MAG: GNAT family N-acetyltransferase [Paludibacteraceae bacterium]|nr:GNAT family N-acetyltransferase [Paludibacteraceae bacterium]